MAWVVHRDASTQGGEAPIEMTHADPRTGPFSAGDKVLDEKYVIRRLLGRGGHAFVYHAYDQFLERDVALKIIVNIAEPGRDLRRRAQVEAQVLTRLSHPNIVAVKDATVGKDGLVYIQMELLEGRSLREVLHDVGPLKVREALAIGAQVAAGAEAAHAVRVVHRDLKPENIFVIKDNLVKVLDFGVAKLVDSKTTQRNVLYGTLPYMSPEYLQGFGVSPRSDIFSLGAVLYELLAGQPPCLVDVQEPTQNVVAWAQIHRMPPRLDELTRTVPAHVARTVHRMLAKQPADRFGTMDEVGEVLRTCMTRIDADGAEETAPVRDLWKQSERTESDGDDLHITVQPTTKFGLRSPFGSTKVVHAHLEPEPPAHRTPPVGVHAPVAPAAAEERSTTTRLDAPDTVELELARSVVDEAYAPNTIPGVTSGPRVGTGARRLVPWPAIRRVVGAALAAGACAGVFLSLWMGPRHLQANAVSLSAAAPLDTPSESAAPVPLSSTVNAPPELVASESPPEPQAPVPSLPIAATQEATPQVVPPMPAMPHARRSAVTATASANHSSRESVASSDREAPTSPASSSSAKPRAWIRERGEPDPNTVLPGSGLPDPGGGHSKHPASPPKLPFSTDDLR